MNIFLGCGIVFLTALAFSRLFGRFKLPSVTAYLLLGILIGPYVLDILPKELIKSANFIGYLVLGTVAFLLGENFFFRELLRIGKDVLVISIGEVLGAFLLVLIGLIAFTNISFPEALLFAGIAPASAPMAIYMVVREMKAKGKFTQTLLDILAIDDAWGIIIFAFALAMSKFLLAKGKVHIFFSILSGFWEIMGSFFLGAFLAFIFYLFSKFIRTPTDMLVYTLGFVLSGVGISLLIHTSPLLTNMVLGAMVVNFTGRHHSFDNIRKIDWPLYLLFFVLAGSSLNVPLLKEIRLLGLIYIIMRIAGLYLGAHITGFLFKSEPRIRKYIGLGLFAQAGVALGLAMVAKAEFPEIGNVIFSTIVATTIIFEIIGPLTCRVALTWAGEKGKDNNGREER